MSASRRPKLTFAALTAERWDDLQALFGERGACGGCWCMFWRLARRDFDAGKGAKNRGAFRRIVKRGDEPGIMAYADGQPVGWCAVAPRSAYPALGRSRVLAPVDEEPVWSVSCFFVLRPWRRCGVSVRLLREAVRHAKRRGARVVEGYPVEPKKGEAPDAFVWTGLPAAFEKAGFREVARRSPTRPIMRHGRPRKRG